MKALLLSLTLICGCIPVIESEKDRIPHIIISHGIVYKDFFSFHAIFSGYYSGGKPVMLNYVGKSAQQSSWGCYDYAKFHSFQTLNAARIDRSSDTLDRSVPLAMGPYFHCSNEMEYIMDFAVRMGFVEFCLDPQYIYPFGEECAYDSLEEKPTEFCLGSQKNNSELIFYKATDYGMVEVSKRVEDKKYDLMRLLMEYGPISVVLIWFPVNPQEAEDKNDFVLSHLTRVYKVDCGGKENLTTKPYHVMSLLGYDNRNGTHFYLQNSNGSNVIYKIEYYDWIERCDFVSINFVEYWEL